MPAEACPLLLPAAHRTVHAESQEEGSPHAQWVISYVTLHKQEAPVLVGPSPQMCIAAVSQTPRPSPMTEQRTVFWYRQPGEREPPSAQRVISCHPTPTIPSACDSRTPDVHCCRRPNNSQAITNCTANCILVATARRKGYHVTRHNKAPVLVGPSPQYCIAASQTYYQALRSMEKPYSNPDSKSTSKPNHTRTTLHSHS